MAFTPEEITNLANAALDFYYTPDGLTPLERSRRRVAAARYRLREAQRELEAALAYRKEVHAMPYAERHTPWLREPGEGPKTFKETIQATPLFDPEMAKRFYEPASNE